MLFRSPDAEAPVPAGGRVDGAPRVPVELGTVPIEPVPVAEPRVEVVPVELDFRESDLGVGAGGTKA